MYKVAKIMLVYEQKVQAKADLIDDLMQEMFGFIDPKTRKKVPGILDNIFNSLNFEAYANDPQKEMGRINEKASVATEEFIAVMLRVGVNTAGMFARDV